MGNAFCHIELNTGDVAAAKKFYKAIFDWKLEDMKGMGYTMIGVGKDGVGGGMQKKPMEEAPNHWLHYVEVADVKKTLAKAKAAGAQIVVDFMPIGETMGAIGIFMDPAGAALGVWQKGKPAPKKAAAKPAKKAAKKAAKKPAKKAAKKGKK